MSARYVDLPEHRLHHGDYIVEIRDDAGGVLAEAHYDWFEAARNALYSSVTVLRRTGWRVRYLTRTAVLAERGHLWWKQAKTVSLVRCDRSN